MRRIAARALLVSALLAACGTGVRAGVGDPRTLVLRGRALAPDGSPLAGARVSARGSASMSALADDHGRWTLTVPIGSPAALRRGGFSLEVRAEAQGRRLAIGAGESALGIEVASASPTGTRVRVRSNSQVAAEAIAGAFAAPGAGAAQVVVDFGGAVRASRAPELRFVGEASEDAGVQVAGANRESLPAAAAPPAAPARRDTPRVAPRESTRAAVPPRSAPVAAVTPPAPAVTAHSAPATPATPAAAEPAPVAHFAATPPAPAASAPPAVAAAADSAPPHAPSHVPARAAPQRRARTSRPAPVVARIEPANPPAARPGAPRGTAGDPPALPAAADSCGCRLRGTVEIEWDKPLEKDFPVELELSGPGRASGGVDMFIGSPREFRFGPLPCGDYTLLVRARGRFRYQLARGDSTLAVPCHGASQVRVVLVPRGR